MKRTISIILLATVLAAAILYQHRDTFLPPKKVPRSEMGPREYTGVMCLGHVSKEGDMLCYRLRDQTDCHIEWKRFYNLSEWTKTQLDSIDDVMYADNQCLNNALERNQRRTRAEVCSRKSSEITDLSEFIQLVFESEEQKVLAIKYFGTTLYQKAYSIETPFTSTDTAEWRNALETRFWNDYNDCQCYRPKN